MPAAIAVCLFESTLKMRRESLLVAHGACGIFVSSALDPGRGDVVNGTDSGHHYRSLDLPVPGQEKAFQRGAGFHCRPSRAVIAGNHRAVDHY